MWDCKDHQSHLKTLLHRKKGAAIILLCLFLYSVFVSFETSSFEQENNIESSDWSDLIDRRLTTPHIIKRINFSTSHLKPPRGFPWHRWGDWKSSFELGLPASSLSATNLEEDDAYIKVPKLTEKILEENNNYPLNIKKFISILSKRGQRQGVTTHLYDLYRQHREGIWKNPLISGQVKVFLFRNGTIHCENGKSISDWSWFSGGAKGYHIDWYQLAANAMNMAKMLENAIPEMKLITEGDFPVIFDHFDYPWCDSDLVPIFRTNLMANKNKCNYAWPGLSLMYLTNSQHKQLRENKEAWYKAFAQREEEFPWESKKDQVVWRGSMTGYERMYKNYVTPRLRLLIKARDSHHESFDIKFVPRNPDPTKNWGRVHHTNEQYRMRFDDFMKYKAVLDLDGYGWSARLGNLLCMNSVVLKVEPEFINYFEKELVPWVHYVPVQDNLSDLGRMVDLVTAKENENKVKSIIKNANEFCSRKFTYDQLTADFLWTLLAYAELLKNAPGFYEEWKNDYNAYNLPALNMAPHINL